MDQRDLLADYVGSMVHAPCDMSSWKVRRANCVVWDNDQAHARLAAAPHRPLGQLSAVRGCCDVNRHPLSRRSHVACRSVSARSVRRSHLRPVRSVWMIHLDGSTVVKKVYQKKELETNFCPKCVLITSKARHFRQRLMRRRPRSQSSAFVVISFSWKRTSFLSGIFHDIGRLSCFVLSFCCSWSLVSGAHVTIG